MNLNPERTLKLSGKLPNNDLTITRRVLTDRLYDSYRLIVNFRRPE